MKTFYWPLERILTILNNCTNSIKKKKCVLKNFFCLETQFSVSRHVKVVILLSVLTKVKNSLQIELSPAITNQKLGTKCCFTNMYFATYRVYGSRCKCNSYNGYIFPVSWNTTDIRIRSIRYRRVWQCHGISSVK